MPHAAIDGANRRGHAFEGAEIVGIFFGGQMLEFAVEALWLFRIGDGFALLSVRGELLTKALDEAAQRSESRFRERTWARWR